MKDGNHEQAHNDAVDLSLSRHVDANAKLIAAAPDLLAACKAALQEFKSIKPHIKALTIEGCISSQVIDTLEIAIMRAEGVNP